MDMQKKVLDKIKSIAEEAGLEFVHNQKYANTGTVMLMDDLTNVIHFGYGFQSDYAVLQFYPGNKEIHSTCGFTHTTCIKDAYLPYHESDKLIELMDWLRRTLGPKGCEGPRGRKCELTGTKT